MSNEFYRKGGRRPRTSTYKQNPIAEHNLDRPLDSQFGPQPDHLSKIEAMAALYVPIEHIIAILKISRSTFELWRKKFPQINEAIARGQAISSQNIRKTIFKKAQEGGKDSARNAKLWFDYIEKQAIKHTIELSGPDKKPMQLETKEMTEEEIVKKIAEATDILKKSVKK